jgi:hypothetical protein
LGATDLIRRVDRRGSFTGNLFSKNYYGDGAHSFTEFISGLFFFSLGIFLRYPGFTDPLVTTALTRPRSD